MQFFDLLGGADSNLNQLRIADELASHRYATGSVALDARPIALAIASGCYRRDEPANNVTPRLTIPTGIDFFTLRHGGMGINQIFNDTRDRAQTMPRRKADIQKFNLDRTLDIYLALSPIPTPTPNGLIQDYGDRTSQMRDISVERLRQEVFRRPIDRGGPDVSEIQGHAVDRENYVVTLFDRPELGPVFNTERVALFRYFLEPLGVSVDKWSMGVRGRSRTYSFADVFKDPPYLNALVSTLETSLNTPGDRFPGLDGPPPFTCTNLTAAVNRAFTLLPDAEGGGAVPKYTDVQRIFNKSCIECHGGLAYPPFARYYDVTYLDLSENEDPALGDRLGRAWRTLTSMGFTQPRAADSRLFTLITRDSENCEPLGPFGMMPCGGPKLNVADIKTIERWINGDRLYSHGDPHIQTIDGTHYDFQSAGEFVLLREQDFELQARQTAVETETPLGPNQHTGLSSCVSINTAAALRVGPHRISYQPNPSGQPDPNGLQLRVDGELVNVGGGLQLSSGGRILPTPNPGGIQIEYPGGTDVVLTPTLWGYQQLWFLQIDLRHARGTEGVMGTVAPGNWLPALPDGTFLGARPEDAGQRYRDLYERFADAWRVTDATSLFNYAPGTSTSTFTIDEWPGQAPQPCRLPKDPDEQGRKPPQKQLPLEVAKQHCARLVTADRRANCELDVMVTGEPVFAEAYLRSENIQLNRLPEVPELLWPEDDKVELPTTVTFDWKRTIDSEGDPLVYRHCVWPTGQIHTFNQCTAMPTQMGMFGGFSGLGRCAWLVIVLIICLIIVIVLFVKKRSMLLVVLGIVIVIAIVLVLYFCRTSNMSRTVNLQTGKAYFWKVLVEDGKGGTTESKTRRFAVK